MGADGRRRVVVTGIGVVCSLGIGREEVWEAAREGRSGARTIANHDMGESRVTIGCEAHDFVPGDFMEHKAARRMDRFSQFAVAAARLALGDAGLSIAGDGTGVGTVIASAGGGGARDHRCLLYTSPSPRD